MAPNHHTMLNFVPLEPVSRTYQYRKIMKPMLERKRRARINKCLDELKDLMTGTLQADDENVSKLEKADILELTVRHLRRLRENNALFLRSNDTLNMERFWAGFQHCATEVTQFLNKYDGNASGVVMKHIANYIPNMTAAAAAAAVTTANYQRMCTAAINPQPKAAAATALSLSVRTQFAAATSAANPVRLHLLPYARTFEAGCGGGSGDSDSDGGVWRPW